MDKKIGYLTSKKGKGKQHIYDENTGKSLCKIENGSRRKYFLSYLKKPNKSICGICTQKINGGKSPKKKKKSAKKKPTTKRSFYQSWEWKRLRYKILQEYDSVCMCCGATALQERIVVDHIKPRSKYPELALDEDNLQVLCNSCNMGKSNDDETDHRP